jgi:hypothetical protein
MLLDFSEGSLHSTTTDTALTTQLPQISTAPTTKLYQIPMKIHTSHLPIKRKVGKRSEKLELLPILMKNVLTF